jgi:uncharacterized membrane protein (UPF0127 family)
MGTLIIQNISNPNSKKLICNGDVCSTPYSRAKGLMFLNKPFNLFFKFDKEGIYPIHSFFVNFLFDAIYLNKHFIVVDYFPSIKPFSPIILPKSKSLYLLEISTNLAKKLKIKVGDKLVVKVKK